MKKPNTVLFISDLHLSPSRSDLTDLFFRFLNGPAQQADALYVLGDLFEGWVGDDDRQTFNLTIQNAFKNLTQQGVSCFFMAGNRDFLVGQCFCDEAGITLLPDPTVIDLFGTPTILLHGDTLCTLDISYQKFRKKVRSPFVQRLFLSLPIALRQRIFNGFRNKSKEHISHKPMNIMDVETNTVETVLDEFQVTQMIHGHVHRPNTHQHHRPHGDCQRFVLGDWGKSVTYLMVTPHHIELKQFPD